MSTQAESAENAQTTETDPAELASRVERLEAEKDQLKERLADVEQAIEETPDTTLERGDHRDVAVLEALDPGERVTVRRFQSLYRRHTDLMNTDTMSDRIRNLVRGPEFEKCGSQVWQYRPQGGDR